MSRLIIKNLPPKQDESKLRAMFEQCGSLTDCSLKYTQEGKFRRFAFVGFRTENEAKMAINKFNKTYIQTYKLQVEIAHGITDVNKPRAWSKYSQDSSTYQRIKKQKEEENKEKTGEDENLKKEIKKRVPRYVEDTALGEVKDDPEFKEFFELHRKGQTALWENDGVLSDKLQLDQEESGGIEKEKRDDQESGVNREEDNDVEEQGSEGEEEEEVTGTNAVSDVDYLKTKVATGSLAVDSDEDEDMTSEEPVKNRKEVKEAVDKGLEEDEGKEPAEEKQKDEQKKKKKKDKKAEEETTKETEFSQYCIKMKGLPPNVCKAQIDKFFKPCKPVSITIPKKLAIAKFCIATVVFATDEETEKAMKKNKTYIGKGKVILKKEDNTEQSIMARATQNKVWESKNEDVEPIVETGRIFVRNLSYSCTEEDLEKLFSKYGEITEIFLPVDKFTKRIKGFAFITFMFPENAATAFSELAGSVFMGRSLHILAGRDRAEEFEITDDMTYKQKQEMQKKKEASSSHNWNALFLGANAVADAMAAKYNTDKSTILDADQNRSLGVRMALGETQIIQETRQFLLGQGVCLDAFSQAAAKRSQTCFLVKNIPAHTTAEELEEVFSKHGEVFKVILPPSGITAIVHMPVAAEAQTAFKRMAYKRFKDAPLYLEWAPLGAMKQEPTGEEKEEVKESKMEVDSTGKDEKEKVDVKEEKDDDNNAEQEEEEETEPVPGCTLFVKNLNFSTREDALKSLFQSCGAIRNVTVVKKKDLKNPGAELSLGYGFVEFKSPVSLKKALKDKQHCKLEGHQLELKESNRTTLTKQDTRKKQADKKQTSTKILVRNIPFQAKHGEVRELFSVFGELKTVRLPKKFSGAESHRGFAFVDFMTKHDAKRAFDALCHSTHLYGRRLVLEWADTEQTIQDLRKATAAHFYEESSKKRLKYTDILGTLEK